MKTALSRGEGRDLAAGLVRYRMLMDKADELYATFDLCLIDRDRREAEFVKLGAADSYLCSGERGMKVIPGVGEKRKRALFDRFETMQDIRDADVEALAAVPGVTRPAAESIYAYFHPDTRKKEN